MSIDTNASVAPVGAFDTEATPGAATMPAMGKGILDPRIRYRPSHDTDIRKTFERVRKELARANQQRDVPLNVSPLFRKEKS